MVDDKLEQKHKEQLKLRRKTRRAESRRRALGSLISIIDTCELHCSMNDEDRLYEVMPSVTKSDNAALAALMRLGRKLRPMLEQAQRELDRRYRDEMLRRKRELKKAYRAKVLLERSKEAAS